MIDQLGYTTDSAGSQIRRDKEQAQGESLNQRRGDDQEIIPQDGPVFFHMIFSVIARGVMRKHRSPEAISSLACSHEIAS